MSKSIRRPNLTASTLLLWPVLGALRYVGADVAAALAEAGLADERASASDSRVPLEQLFALWRTSVERTGDPALGVRIAALTDPFSTVSWPMPLALFEHLGMVSATLADAIVLQSRFVRLLRDGLHTTLELTGDRAVLRLEVTPGEPPALIEQNLATAINLARRVLKRELALHEVWFSHAGSPELKAYARLFKAPIRFGAPFNALIGSAADFTQPLPAANPLLRSRVIAHAEKLLAKLPNIEMFEDEVCVQIRAELPAGNTNAGAIAEKLGVSARTLHRRLQQEGTGYQELLDRVRLRLALQHLEDGKAIAEVALLVGFAQASTFHRAFKSWTGETPADYQLRKRASAGPARGGDLDEALA